MAARPLRSTRASSLRTSKSASTPTRSKHSRSIPTGTSSDSTTLPKPTSPTRYFLIIASRDHVLTALQGGFCQANHGKKSPLQQMRKGDGVLFYSARETYTPKSKGRPQGEVCQRFTAMGRVSDEEIYQVKAFEGFEPWRRKVEFVKGGREVGIVPLIERLGFIRDKKNWGMSLRFGFVKIGEGDWRVVHELMTGEDEGET